MDTDRIVRNAKQAGLVVPAFNIPYLPMVEPGVRAVRDQDAFALIEVARPEWEKFESKSLKDVFQEFRKYEDPDHVRLHLDHVPVIDEDNLRVDYMPIFKEAIDLGYQSVMLDGSRLSLEENIRATREVAQLAHAAGIPCEAELGAVLGHEQGPLPPYEELFTSGRGFTRIDEAARFVQESGCDWLSVAIGNVHGQISAAARDKKKVAARLHIPHLEKLAAATAIPLVLHGGSGIQQKYVLQAIKAGIAKMNIGTEIRQVYEVALEEGISEAQEAVYKSVSSILKGYLGLSGTSKSLQ